MKKLLQLSLFAALGIASLSSDVQAGSATAGGALCKPLSTGSYIAGTVEFLNTGSSSMVVSCPVPMDSVKLGSTVIFRLRGKDLSSSAGFSCTAYVNNQNGSIVASVGPLSTDVAGTGTFTLGPGQGWSVSNLTNVDTNMYVIQCEVPGNFSTIYTVRAE